MHTFLGKLWFHKCLHKISRNVLRRMRENLCCEGWEIPSCHSEGFWLAIWMWCTWIPYWMKMLTLWLLLPYVYGGKCTFESACLNAKLRATREVLLFFTSSANYKRSICTMFRFAGLFIVLKLDAPHTWCSLCILDAPAAVPIGAPALPNQTFNAFQN